MFVNLGSVVTQRLWATFDSAFATCSKHPFCSQAAPHQVSPLDDE
jgi:hypothetical protein